MNPAEAPRPMPLTDLRLPPGAPDDDEIKRLIASVTEGLTDDDPHRPGDLGRECGPFLDAVAT